MSRWYEVRCTKFCTMMVEVEDHEGMDDAYEVATLNDNWDEMTACEITPKELDSHLRHADEIERL